MRNMPGFLNAQNFLGPKSLLFIFGKFLHSIWAVDMALCMCILKALYGICPYLKDGEGNVELHFNFICG